MKKMILIIAGMLLLASVQIASANDDTRKIHGVHYHGPLHGDKDSQQMSSMKKGMFLEKKDIDGYAVSFHAMAVKKNMQHGGTHNYLIKVEKDGTALGDLTVNSKVTHPNGKSESKMMMKMGDWYMAGYDLGHKGEHQLMVLFKTPDGKKHFGGVHYSEMISVHEKSHSHEMTHE
ncbi:hypothetical protein D8Y20_09080 [Mariprofundus sp. EBB-1]|uniref:hypothetical protein n=1 Tax=Mariprofundus sp. EBB-1 TaxID=2650971 RepID=UPI000EF26CB1|nr:hypothetical protein [Mariprofundus sp. EBB-1]RLL51535.1 hypothetical protein D8Y20_09080 [Mariprofundus sp. EBB-1]